MIKSNQSQVAEELTILEHNLQHLLMQRQNLESQLSEIGNALSEVSKSTSDVYHVTGSVMLKASKQEITHELENKKKIIDARLSAIDKQEKLLDFKAKELQKEVRDSSKS